MLVWFISCCCRSVPCHFSCWNFLGVGTVQPSTRGWRRNRETFEDYYLNYAHYLRICLSLERAWKWFLPTNSHSIRHYGRLHFVYQRMEKRALAGHQPKDQNKRSRFVLVLAVLWSEAFFCRQLNPTHNQGYFASTCKIWDVRSAIDWCLGRISMDHFLSAK